MMTFEQVATMLDILCTNFKVQPAGEPEIDIWHGHLRNRDPEQAMKAADKIVAEENFFPTIAKFLGFYESLTPSIRELGRAEFDPDCVFCRGAGWGEMDPLVVEDAPGRAYEQWMPCRSCNPSGYARWLEVRKPPWKPQREETYEANPRQWIDKARDVIKDTSDL